MKFLSWLIVFFIFNAPLAGLCAILVSQGINGWAAAGIVLGANMLGYIEGLIRA